MSSKSVRQRPTPTPTKQASTSDTLSDTLGNVEEDNTTPRGTSPQQQQQPPKSKSKSKPKTRRALSQTLSCTANLANLLPTGTLLAFQMLTPVFTNNGFCDSVTRPLTMGLLLLLGLSCFVACFTDTVKTSDGQVYHGFATFNGLWLFDYPDPDPSTSGLPDLRKYKVRFIDFVHALLSVLVFCAVALKDKNLLSCFYPKPEHETQEVLDIVPVGIGLISALLFVVFPTTRHGIGFPVTSGK
ncbi:protein DMP3-like [Gastrolobium bilobum]|uniref:protein DMP3-like n=1 Tax=Gastrolobium bilobum TaxID=150636 RepID=UPI002AB01A8F|nr:protein DMP3-like [Gastrolobium bilobum]